MNTLTIAMGDKSVVRLQTKPGGDLELVSSETVPDQETRNNVIARGVFDKTIAVIPKSKRAEVANFLLNA